MFISTVIKDVNNQHNELKYQGQMLESIEKFPKACSHSRTNIYNLCTAVTLCDKSKFRVGAFS